MKSAFFSKMVGMEGERSRGGSRATNRSWSALEEEQEVEGEERIPSRATDRSWDDAEKEDEGEDIKEDREEEEKDEADDEGEEEEPEDEDEGEEVTFTITPATPPMQSREYDDDNDDDDPPDPINSDPIGDLTTSFSIWPAHSDPPREERKRTRRRKVNHNLTHEQDIENAFADWIGRDVLQRWDDICLAEPPLHLRETADDIAHHAELEDAFAEWIGRDDLKRWDDMAAGRGEYSVDEDDGDGDHDNDGDDDEEADNDDDDSDSEDRRMLRRILIIESPDAWKSAYLSLKGEDYFNL